MMRRSVASFLLLSIALLASLSAPGATPATIWVASLSGVATIDDAWQAGATVLDRFPEALILGDATSAERLIENGFQVEGPLPLMPDANVTLLRRRIVEGAAKQAAHRTTDREILEAIPDGRLIWSDGVNLIVEAVDDLPEAPAILALARQILRTRPIQQPLHRFAGAGGGGGSSSSATTILFPAVIDEMVTQLTAQTYIDWLGNLAGANQIWVGGGPFVFTTRYTKSTQCDTAEQYVYERFLAMGFTDVELDPFSFSTTDAQNVIATLPGVETPNQIYILCGHLDSTSPDPYNLAPGANDNGSGTAAVLAAAEIMSQYQFRSTIKFIAFTGEEQGLRGSRHYAQNAAANGDSIMGVVNCDMVAYYDLQYAIDIEGGNPWEWLMFIMRDACVEYTTLGTNLTYYSWGSDHVSFQDEGYAAFLAIESDWASYPCYHQTCDLTGENDADFGAQVTRACMATIAYLAEPVAGTGVAAGTGAVQVGLRLDANRPNPFNPQTTISFELPAADDAVRLAIYDVSGRQIRSLLSGGLGAGRHEVAWDGRTAAGEASASGVYWYVLEVGEGTLTRRMVLAR